MPEMSKRSRRRFALGLRGLMLLVLAAGGGFGYLAHRAQVQRRAVAAIRAAGGSVRYDFQELRPGTPRPATPIKSPPGPTWLRRWIGDEYFQEVFNVYFSDPKSTKIREGLIHVRDLPRLKRAFLKGPGVDDAVLAQLSGSSRLEVLWLEGANVTDAGVAELAGLPRLNMVDLIDSPEVTDAGVDLLARTHPAMEALELGGTGITDTATFSLRKLVGLKTLSLDRTKVTDAGLARLAGLTRLEVLKLRGTAVTDEGLRTFREVKTMQRLYLDRTAITGQGLAHLAGMTGMLQLQLASTKIDDAGLAHLEGMKELSFLILSNTAIGDDGVAHLAKLTRLNQLFLSRTRMSDAGLVHLQGLPDLRRVYTVSSQVTDAGYAAFRKAAPRVNAGSNQALRRPAPVPAKPR